MLGAFQWSNKGKTETSMTEETAVAVEEESVPITTDVPPPPPEAPKEPVMSDVIDIVDNNV